MTKREMNQLRRELEKDHPNLPDHPLTLLRQLLGVHVLSEACWCGPEKMVIKGSEQ